MSVGLLAVVDDILAAALKASAKSAGVVIDDAAVTPQYVQGITPARELPVVGRIALGSLANKFLLIIPAAMALSTFAPWVLPWLFTVRITNDQVIINSDRTKRLVLGELAP